MKTNESLVVRCPIGHAQYFIMLRLKRLTQKTSDGYQVIIKRYLSIQLSNYCNHNGVLLFDIFGYCTRFQFLFFLW